MRTANICFAMDEFLKTIFKHFMYYCKNLHVFAKSCRSKNQTEMNYLMKIHNIKCMKKPNV